MSIRSLILLLLFCSCTTIGNFRSEQEVHIATVNNNVCKRLKGDVVLYAIFVDSKYTGIWSEFDITSTLDSIQIAMEWIESKAQKAGVDLKIVVDKHQD